MKKSDFSYELPPGLIAQAPLPERSASRMLVVPPGDAAFVDARVRDLGDWLRQGDLLVFNDTRVLPARLQSRVFAVDYLHLQRIGESRTRINAGDLTSNDSANGQNQNNGGGGGDDGPVAAVDGGRGGGGDGA